MKRFATAGVRRRKCPLCGGEIIVSDLYQYSHDYKIGKNGKLSKRYRTTDGGTMEVSVASCGNGCEANWGAGEFEITEDGRFIDYKYRKEAAEDA